MTTKLKRGAAAWAIAFALLLAWTGLASVANTADRNRYQDDIAQEAKLERFYRVVAGDISGDEPGPSNKLARDLRDLDRLEVTGFTGDSNRYGGVSGALGFDPFNGANCSECGPLDFDVAADVIKIKDGGLGAVLAARRAQIRQAREIGGPPWFLWVAWLLSWPIYAAVVYTRVRRQEETRYRDFAIERKLINDLREAQRELPPGNPGFTDSLGDLANRLQAQVEMRVNYKESKKRDMRIDQLTQEAVSVLESVSEGNKELT